MAATRRERTRQATIREICEIARQQVAAEGPGALSLRAVARDLGMVSSALYRYFPSRDALLHALIAESADAFGDAVEAADAGVRQDQFRARWVAVAGAVRAWALAHPADWSLLFGAPVPRAAAVSGTEGAVPADARLAVVLVRLLDGAHAAGALAPPGAGPVPRALGSSCKRLRKELGVNLPDAALVAAPSAVALLVGAVGLEVFGHAPFAVDDADALFRTQVDRAAALLGLR